MPAATGSATISAKAKRRMRMTFRKLLENPISSAISMLNGVLQASYDWNSQNAQCLANQSSSYTAERRRQNGNSRITPI